MLVGGLAGDQRERDVDQRDRQDEQEVRRVVLPHDVDARDREEQDEPGEGHREQHADEPDPRAVLHVPSMDRSGATPPPCGGPRRTTREPPGAHVRLRIVGYGSRAPPGDPRRAIERASPADRLASRLRIAGSTNTEARWREEAATSCWEPPSAGSVPSRARRRGGVAPRSDARRCCRRTTARRRASCIRLRPGGRRSRGRSATSGRVNAPPVSDTGGASRAIRRDRCPTAWANGSAGT